MCKVKKKVLVARLCLMLLRSHGLKPAKLLCPWNSPDKNTGVGCHSLLQGIFLTDPGIKPGSPALQADSLLSESLDKRTQNYWEICK